MRVTSIRTWIVKTSALAAGKELAFVIMRLRMVMNDIVMASGGLGEWTSNPRTVDRQQSARLYYGRKLMSHVYEALSIIAVNQKRDNLKHVPIVRTRQKNGYWLKFFMK